jgi:release factor glutamine methyltransferase
MAETKEAVRLDALLRQTAAVLRGAGIADAGREARLLVQHIADISAVEALVESDFEVGEGAGEAVRGAVQRRAAGEPLHRILGRRAFYGIELTLSPATLEPRPDTEILVDRIIPHARRIAAEEGTCRLLDLGTGTGAIALAILAEVEKVVATGVDIEPGAVATALRNAHLNGLERRFRAVESNWFSGVNEKFHIIVSNPPYISGREFETLPEDVRRFDPETALLGGADGLDAYRAIAGSAAGYLERNGIIGVEIGYSQREAVTAIFSGHGFQVREQARDLAGHDRVLIFSR